MLKRIQTMHGLVSLAMAQAAQVFEKLMGSTKFRSCKPFSNPKSKMNLNLSLFKTLNKKELPTSSGTNVAKPQKGITS
jgi:hypothetical protein